jgi:hypothetical protein
LNKVVLPTLEVPRRRTVLTDRVRALVASAGAVAAMEEEGGAHPAEVGSASLSIDR